MSTEGFDSVARQIEWLEVGKARSEKLALTVSGEAEHAEILGKIIASLKRLPSPTPGSPSAGAEPVAWRVRQREGDWLLYGTETEANISAAIRASHVEPLYASPPQPERTGRGEWYRHKKRGVWVQVLFEATGQFATSDGEVYDDAVFIVYQHVDGSKWVRPRAEFHDGRFEPVPATPQETGHD